MDRNSNTRRLPKRRRRMTSLSELRALLGDVPLVASGTDLSATLVYVARLLPQIEAIPFQDGPYVRAHNSLVAALERAYQGGPDQA